MVERPREGMAHILYPQHEHVQFHGRSEDGLQSLPTWEADRQELLDRQRMRRASGWASDLREEYKPLGPPVELPPLGSQLRKKKNAAGSTPYRRPKIVLPVEKVAEGKVHAKPLFDGGWLHEESVQQNEYAYYSFELRERKVLVITVEVLHGDADIFVSNEGLPSEAEHSWRSPDSGEDGVGEGVEPEAEGGVSHTLRASVSPDHPRYAYPCAYYVAVFSRSDSEFHIRATLEDVPFRLNVSTRTPESNGFGALASLVSKAEERRVASRFRSPREGLGMHEVRLEAYECLPPQLQVRVKVGVRIKGRGTAAASPSAGSPSGQRP